MPDTQLIPQNTTPDMNSSKEHTDNNKPAQKLRTLIVDNYDSYTFNLLQLFDQDQLENVVVIRNDQFTWSEFEHHILPHFDQIILSPGPGRPERAQDFGICTQILKTDYIPVFGVCLGHQGIGWIHGAKVTYGPEPVHGQIARIKHDGTGIFQGIPQDFEVVRYHSLVIQEQNLPTNLIPTAWCYSLPLISTDNITKLHTTTTITTNMPEQGFKSIMGIRHKTLPHHGVQFHPESICTQYGKNMMKNFFTISLQFYKDQSRLSNGLLPDHIKAISVISTGSSINSSIPTLPIPKIKSNPYSLIIRSLDPSIFPDPESVFSSLFLTSPKSNAASWWLDSARQPHPMSRFSFMGGIDTRSCQGPQHDRQPINGGSQAVIQYSTLHKEIHIRRYNSASKESDIKQIKLNDATNTQANTFWDWVSNTMADFSKDNIETTVTGPRGEQQNFSDIPFDFFAGMIGYFGYEMKRESLSGYHIPVEQGCSCIGHSEDGHPCSCNCQRQPDAAFILATQAVVFDHAEKRIYILGVVNNFRDREHRDIGAPLGFQSREACQSWIQGVARSIEYIASGRSASKRPKRQPVVSVENSGLSKNGEPYHVRQMRRRRSSVSMLSPFKVDVAEQDYIKAIQDSLHYIHEGESYELCLTTQFRTKLPLKRKYIEFSSDSEELIDEGDPAFDLYKIIRKLNPAPFSTYMSIPTALDPDYNANNQTCDLVGKLIVLSSSPERFLKIGRKPTDDPKILRGSKESLNSRTVEMKPIKGTVAVAKGCFCKEDEGCKLDDDSSSGHDDDDSPINGGDKLCRAGDKCADSRKRENQHRIDSLSRNIKERAENLMIVDLIRNDLAQVCRSESVRVPYLMNVESYETVHQLVTTVRGELFDHVDSAQAVRACFPPGSMTGAPKLRSVQLLDSLENNVRRGIYSGCIGYIGFSAVAAADATDNLNENVKRKVRSAVDFAVVIRTAVLSVTPQLDNNGINSLFADLSVGAGGALTILSDAKEEWREVLLKSRSVVPSVLTYLHQDA